MVRPLIKNEKINKAYRSFCLYRSAALDDYVEIERCQASLFATLSGMNRHKAFIVFSSIFNARARLKLMKTFLELEFAKEYEVFFKGLRKNLEKIDASRNKLAHWQVENSTPDGKDFNPDTDISLYQSPNIYALDQMYLSEIKEFTKQAQFYGALVFRFEQHLKFGQQSYPKKEVWTKVFKETPTYPPEKDHPLYR